MNVISTAAQTSRLFVQLLWLSGASLQPECHYVIVFAVQIVFL